MMLFIVVDEYAYFIKSKHIQLNFNEQVLTQETKRRIIHH